MTKSDNRIGFTVRLPESDDRTLESVANLEGKSKSGLAAILIREGLAARLDEATIIRRIDEEKAALLAAAAELRARAGD